MWLSPVQCHRAQVAELCDKASSQVGPGEGVRIANFLCPGNYAVSGGVKGCDVVESIAKPEFKVPSECCSRRCAGSSHPPGWMTY